MNSARRIKQFPLFQGMGKLGALIKDSLVAEYLSTHLYVTKFTKRYTGAHAQIWGDLSTFSQYRSFNCTYKQKT